MPHDFDSLAKKIADSQAKGEDVKIGDLIGDIDMAKLQKDTEVLMDLPEQIINAFEAIKLLNKDLETAKMQIEANQNNIRSLNKTISLMKENSLLNRKG
jgi:hypothetical protein